MRHLRVLLPLALAASLGAQTPKRVLFDHTRHEEAGTSAEWVICSGSEPDPSPANPASETDWNGGISAWGFDLHQAGYAIQTLPPTGRVTYGDATNPQDLANYAVYIIDEPYVKFTAAEKQAILGYVQNGGGLFVVGNHVGANRYSGTGGTDAFTVFNDMVVVNGANPYGFTFVAGHGPGDAQANTTSTAFSTSASPAAQAIVNGSFGSLGLMDFHSYSYLNFNTAQNPNVQEILHTQVSGDTGSFIVTCTVGSGRVVAISDSAPADDGTTTTSGKSLHASWGLNSNRAFFLNATAYLAGATSTAPVPVVSIVSPAANTSIAAGGSVSFQGSASISDGSALSYSWSFGDGASAAVLGPVSHTYPAAGTYTATFTAASNQGQSASATRTITVTGATDTQPPTVSVTESGASGSLTFSATASDNVGVTKVEFYLDGALTGTDTTSPYTLAFDSTTVANGSHSLVAKAYDAAGNVGTSSAVSFTVSNGTGGSTTTQILGNPGFETGTANPWAAAAGILDNGTSEAAHSGSWKAWLDGYGSAHTDTLSQQVAIDPAATAASLSFWLHIDTAETTTSTAYDTLKVQIRNASGTVLATLATYSNLNAASGFAQKSFDLSAYKGQTLQVYLVGTEDSSAQTSFVLDDFALNVTTGSGGGSTDTTAPAVSATESGTSGTITLNATATDNVGVTKVEFYVDGTLKGTDTAAPYATTLDSTTLANGSHSLVAKAYDAAGNVGTSTAVAFSVSNTSGSSSLAESFDTGTKTAYATGAVSLASGTWTLNDALLGSSASDPHNGAQAVRVRNSGKVTMGFDFPTGANTVSVKHAKYGSDASTTWGLWYSTDGGTTWSQAGSPVTTSSTTLATATFSVGVTGPIRFELRKTDGTSNRVDFDDFAIAGY
jgi:hypothetical protein